MRSSDLTLFAHVAGRSESELDLARAALLIAEPEYPGLDVAHYVERIDRLADEVRGPSLAAVLDLLYGRLGFHGNESDYYDPRNSFLNEVLDRRMGIPITLAVVVIEVARRIALPLAGVSFPGHFLVRTLGERAPTFVDPFTGRVLSSDDLRALHERVGGKGDPDQRALAAATKRQILVRILRNLRGIYDATDDATRLRAVLERLVMLAPSDDLREEIARLDARGIN